jgi:hypothetical protein
MSIGARAVVWLVAGGLLFVGCGEDSSPSAASPLPETVVSPSGVSTSRSAAAAATGLAGASESESDSDSDSVTAVAAILSNPGGFVGREVRLVGKLVQPLSDRSFLFTDGTGALPADFDPAASLPPLNDTIEMTGTVTPGTGDFTARIQVLSWDAQPPFSCDEVVEVRARFSDPGFVAGDVVGLYLAYLGVPAGEKTLQIDWGDGEADTARLGEGSPNGEGLFDLQGVVGHEYVGIQGTEAKSVRADMFIDGRDGSCGRVRDVTVSQGSGPGFAAGGNLRLELDDPVGSGGFFAVSATVTNPTSHTIEANLVFTTPDRSAIRALGSECRKISEEVAECRIEGIEANASGGTFVQYDVPEVTAPTQIRGSVTLVSRDFSPVANYSTTIKP